MKYKLNVKRDVDTDEPGAYILNLPGGFKFTDDDHGLHVKGFDSMAELRREAKTNVEACDCAKCN